ncbi:unnamed protein product, partial [Amoebophrya sp. A120]|eukprot:GSA120T00006087001.1
MWPTIRQGHREDCVGMRSVMLQLCNVIFLFVAITAGATGGPENDKEIAGVPRATLLISTSEPKIPVPYYAVSEEQITGDQQFSAFFAIAYDDRSVQQFMQGETAINRELFGNWLDSHGFNYTDILLVTAINVSETIGTAFVFGAKPWSSRFDRQTMIASEEGFRDFCGSTTSNGTGTELFVSTIRNQAGLKIDIRCSTWTDSSALGAASENLGSESAIVQTTITPLATTTSFAAARTTMVSTPANATTAKDSVNQRKDEAGAAILAEEVGLSGRIVSPRVDARHHLESTS